MAKLIHLINACKQLLNNKQVCSASKCWGFVSIFFQDRDEKEHTLRIIYNNSPQSGVKHGKQAAITTLIVVSAGASACLTLQTFHSPRLSSLHSTLNKTAEAMKGKLSFMSGPRYEPPAYFLVWVLCIKWGYWRRCAGFSHLTIKYRSLQGRSWLRKCLLVITLHPNQTPAFHANNQTKLSYRAHIFPFLTWVKCYFSILPFILPFPSISHPLTNLFYVVIESK